MARNVWTSTFRRAGRREAVPGPEVTDPWKVVDQRLDAAAPAPAAPAVRRSLAELPVDHRDLLLLVSREQLPPAEAAAAGGIPAVTARSRPHRARIDQGDQGDQGDQVGQVGQAGQVRQAFASVVPSGVRS
ncbi:hypothetical protein OHB41_41715 [Streptomyces sp. NBC_01571]|uniref:sigma factor-like helix-turn-helix DNA-binding protein n=1 Tax=Streptomyces sp. NBC_01571 TaxID=2975883 RepID=UPI00225B1210|nr:sigma factor-like helix-turn-helix DNA-binding protein [Streptomyces sp. NBC_01571]MCX4579593.1 hypothetical protein [Streptomyces sp. NBC_01571]